MFRFAQVRVTLPEFCSQRARKFNQARIAQISNAQFRHTTLTHTEEIAGSAQLQICLRQAEPIISHLEHFQALLGLNTGIGTEYITIRLMYATPDAPAKLVQL